MTVGRGKPAVCFLLWAAAFPYSWKAVRFGFQLSVDIFAYPDKPFCKGVQIPGARPRMQSVVGAGSEKDVHFAQLAEGIYRLFLASGSSSSIQLEGGSMWIPAVVPYRWSIPMSPVRFVCYCPCNESVRSGIAVALSHVTSTGE